jgi:hypothetical protein
VPYDAFFVFYLRVQFRFAKFKLSFLDEVRGVELVSVENVRDSTLRQEQAKTTKKFAKNGS